MQMDMIGVGSLTIVAMTGFFSGAVMALQMSRALAQYGQVGKTGTLVSLTLVRELGPVLTAIMVAGRNASGIASELGSMKVTEQIDAMEVSAIHPFRYLVVTRVLAMTVCLPLLMFYNGLIGCLGSYVDVHVHEQTSFIAFFDTAFTQITFLDYATALTKAIVYGFTIGIVSCYQGFNASQGTTGVGKAANVSVIVSMFLIFIEEVIIVHIFNSIR